MQLFKIYWPDNGGGIAAVMDMVSHAFEFIANKLDDRECRQEMVVCRPRPGMPFQQDEYHGVNVYRCRTFADIAKAKKIIDYDPKTTFEEGISKFIKWYKDNQSLYK